uniref:Uncharacterized protein n=1 Tax=Caudovirales sp. ctvQY7 TaxID=2825774 RepID=A0A8S5UFQ0_9CAUD|nr:MAG TPA: hypothetical protein [Caudovirales sp. ctvQY7]DAW25050.1 MAG TPA: hypothetical protein [Caudoviricetes sp.]
MGASRAYGFKGLFSIPKAQAVGKRLNCRKNS